MYPLRFEPIFRRYLWGGRRLATELGKQIGDESCAESWEVVDRPEANSVVMFGELAGKTLHELVQQSGSALLGQQVHQQISRSELPEKLRGRFPLLLKFLDANKTLSVQVHPDDAAGMTQSVPDLGKTEAWYVMDAKPGSQIFGGLKSGIDRQALASAIDSKTTNEVLHTFEAQKGDCVFVPAGTVHAIGEGLLIAEIQQCSDTTFRLFDWNRVDADGNERDLHVDQALQVTDYDRGPVDPQPAIFSDNRRVRELISCDKFVIRRWNLESSHGESVKIDLNDCFRLLMVTDGQIVIAGDPSDQPLCRGQSMLVPASLNSIVIDNPAIGDSSVENNAEFLEISIPDAS